MESKGMKFDAIIARSFSRQERKKLGCSATLALFIFIFIFCIFFNAKNDHLAPSPPPNVQVPTGGSLNLEAIKHRAINIAPQPYSKINKAKSICDLKRPRSDVCDANGDIRVIGNSSTIFVISNDTHSYMSWTIRPYARKSDEAAMKNVGKITIKQVHHSSHHQQIPSCTRMFNVSAVVFSTKGYLGNIFHDFSDLLIPLYQTSRKFEGEVQFLVKDKQLWWMDKYKHVLQMLSKYEDVDLDNVKREVLCFPRMIIGLKANKEFSIDVAASDHSNPYSMKNFTEFLRSAYGLKRATVSKTLQQSRRLLIISRTRTRRFLNVGEVSDMAKGLGFDVVVQEIGWNMRKVSEFVNGFDVMVGVHGAGLSNMVFLPKNAVVVQVVGLGMDEIAKRDFEIPRIDMGLRYLSYKIGVNESSLVDQYPVDHQVLRNPIVIFAKGWKAFGAVYLDRQDVKIDVNRFRGSLLKALELLHT